MSTAKSEPNTGVLFLRALLPVIILAGGVGGFMALYIGLREELPVQEDGDAVPSAIVELVRSHDEGLTIQADGVVVPYREVEISAEVAGRIIERTEACRAGRYVRQGEPLVTIDPEDYQLEVDRLQEELDQARIALEEWSEQIEGTQRLMKIAQKELELRTRELTRLNAAERTAFSLSDLERAEAAKLAADNTLETLRNRQQLLGVGKARLESAWKLSQLKHRKALLDLERTRVVAPTDGVVIAEFIEEDSFVQRGTPLLTLEDTSKAEVSCKLPMEDLYWLWDRTADRAPSADQQTPALPAPDAFAAAAYDIPDVDVDVVYRLAGHCDVEYTWQGRLERYDGLGLDERTRTVPCRVVVDRPRDRLPLDRSGPPALLRGMYVTVRIRIQPRTPLLEVPEAGLRPGNHVWRVRDGKLAIVPVNFVTLLEKDTSGERDQRRTALIYIDQSRQADDLLNAGDQVVISPLVFVRTGMDIEVDGRAAGRSEPPLDGQQSARAARTGSRKKKT